MFGRFATILTQLRGIDLDTWLAAVVADDLPPLHSFATGLRLILGVVCLMYLPDNGGGSAGAPRGECPPAQRLLGGVCCPWRGEQIALPQVAAELAQRVQLEFVSMPSATVDIWRLRARSMMSATRVESSATSPSTDTKDSSIFSSRTGNCLM